MRIHVIGCIVLFFTMAVIHANAFAQFTFYGPPEGWQTTMPDPAWPDISAPPPFVGATYAGRYFPSQVSTQFASAHFNGSLLLANGNTEDVDFGSIGPKCNVFGHAGNDIGADYVLRNCFRAFETTYTFIGNFWMDVSPPSFVSSNVYYRLVYRDHGIDGRVRYNNGQADV